MLKPVENYRAHERGLTLIEVMVVVVLGAILTTGAVLGTGAATNARVKSASTIIASAIRVAFTRSSSTSKCMRVVLDMDRQSVLIEETSRPMLVRRDDETGGAEGVTEQEKEAIKEGERMTQGPKAARPMFKPVKAFGFDADDPSQGRPLGRGVAIKRVEVARSDKPQTSGRAYLYFWPGGMTERAAIELGRKDDTDTDTMLTVLVSPLTGKVKIAPGSKPMEKLRDESEREDRNF